MLRAIWRWLLRDRWEVRRTKWPYAEGWGTYNHHRRAIADVGLSREEAEERAEDLNAQGS